MQTVYSLAAHRRKTAVPNAPLYLRKPPGLSGMMRGRLLVPVVVTRCVRLLLICFAVVVPGQAQAHELPQRVSVKMIISASPGRIELMLRAPLEAMRDVDFPLTPEGFLQLAEAQPYLEDAAGLWLVDNLQLRRGKLDLEPGQVTVRAALPGDRAFASAASAAASFARPLLPDATQIFWRQAMLDVRVRYPSTAAGSLEDMFLDASLRALGVETTVELLLVEPSGEQHSLSFDGDVRDLPLMPSGWRVAADFLRQGFVHILGGIDHLLFLLCLVLPLREVWPLVKAVTAFTAAHSVTLAAAALGWIPTPLWFASAIEALIALSILFLALENILRREIPRRWFAAFGFGLIHGFGFASALSESLQYAQGQLVVALAGFNLGVEFGQLLVLAVLVPLMLVLLRRVPSERVAIIVASTLIAHTAWHWMTERMEALSGYFF
ncbi:MAG: HupE/UreJ family protein [Pseudomonadota bacterium]